MVPPGSPHRQAGLSLTSYGSRRSVDPALNGPPAQSYENIRSRFGLRCSALSYGLPQAICKVDFGASCADFFQKTNRAAGKLEMAKQVRDSRVPIMLTD